MRVSASIAILRTQPDERLVGLARNGSEPAFAALVERHRRTVLSRCRCVLPEARAEDAAQVTFLSAWKALRRGDEVVDVRAWLLRIARNSSLNALRSPGYDYDELRESVRAADTPESEFERRSALRRTLTGLAELPERQREVLLLSAVGGVPHADIAREMGLSEGATRQLLLRARSALRSAAAVLTPSPVITWAATARSRAGAGSAELVQRAGEAAFGGTAAGGAVAAKLGVVAVVATGAVATPMVVDDVAPRERASKAVTERVATPPARVWPKLAPVAATPSLRPPRHATRQHDPPSVRPNRPERQARGDKEQGRGSGMGAAAAPRPRAADGVAIGGGAAPAPAPAAVQPLRTVPAPAPPAAGDDRGSGPGGGGRSGEDHSGPGEHGGGGSGGGGRSAPAAGSGPVPGSDDGRAGGSGSSGPGSGGSPGAAPKPPPDSGSGSGGSGSAGSGSAASGGNRGRGGGEERVEAPTPRPPQPPPVTTTTPSSRSGSSGGGGSEGGSSHSGGASGGSAPDAEPAPSSGSGSGGDDDDP